MTGYRSGMSPGDPAVMKKLRELRANPGLAPQDFVNTAAAAAWRTTTTPRRAATSSRPSGRCSSTSSPRRASRSSRAPRASTSGCARPRGASGHGLRREAAGGRHPDLPGRVVRRDRRGRRVRAPRAGARRGDVPGGGRGVAGDSLHSADELSRPQAVGAGMDLLVPLALTFVGPRWARRLLRCARLRRPRAHLGEDWNGVGGGDTDLGDPVHAIADGSSVAEDAAAAGATWCASCTAAARAPPVESLYAHLDSVDASVRPAAPRGERARHHRQRPRAVPGAPAPRAARGAGPAARRRLRRCDRVRRAAALAGQAAEPRR